MNRTRTTAVLAFSAALCLPALAHAQLRAGVGLEYFNWKEDIAATPVEETGAMVSGWLEWTLAKEAGLVPAYRGRIYGGTVDYDGWTLNAPYTKINSTTEYIGTSQEGQARWRFDVRGNRALDLVAGVGFDVWQRKLSTIQKEQYFIGFARLGVETESRGEGWLAGAGVKYPFYTYENAYFQDIGYSSNPALKPGKNASPYLLAGYRFKDPFSVVFYVDSFSFSQSPVVNTVKVSNGAPTGFVQPASDRYSVGVRVMYELR